MFEVEGGEAAAAAGGGGGRGGRGRGGRGGGQGASGCSHGLDNLSTEKLLSTRVIQRDRDERQVRRAAVEAGSLTARDSAAADEYLRWTTFK